MCLCNPVENAETKVCLLAGIHQQCVFQSKILPRNVPTTLQVVRSLANTGIPIYPHHIKPSQNKEIAIHYQMAAIDCCCLAIWRISPTLMTSNDKSQDNVFQMAKTFFRPIYSLSHRHITSHRSNNYCSCSQFQSFLAPASAEWSSQVDDPQILRSNVQIYLPTTDFNFKIIRFIA